MKTIILFLFLALPIFALSQTAQQYEYLTMTQYNSVITISYAESFESIDVRDEKKSKNVAEFSQIIKRIQKFESEGWEIFSNAVYITGNGYEPQNYVMMRRKI